VASEGGARSQLWRQIAADILNRPIQYLRDNPGSAYGTALLAGVALNIIPSWQDIAHMTRIEHETQPNPDHEEVYRQNYHVYRALYPKLKKLF
jgi:xylulokinase